METQPLETLNLDSAIAEASRSLADANERIMAFIKERPAVCVLGAIFAGYIVGRLAARS